MEHVYESLLDVLSTMEVCAESGRVLPALVLGYTTIDALGWMTAVDSTEQVRKRFTAWTDEYLIPASRGKIQCTAIELYAARCGILHTFTSESDLGKQPGVRTVAYAWGKARREDLELALRRTRAPAVAMHVSDFTEAVRHGTADCFERAQSDLALAQRMQSRGDRYYAHLRGDAFDAFLGRRGPTGSGGT